MATNPRSRPKADLREVAMENPSKLELDDGGGDADRASRKAKRRSSRLGGPGPVAVLRGTGRAVSGTATGAGKYAGRGMLEAELVFAIVIIAIRMVADYTPSPNGPAYKGTVVPSGGQLGPLSIFAALITVFIVLSFASKRGGTTAKLAVILGGIVVLTLAMKSWTQISEVAGAITRTASTASIVTTDSASGGTYVNTADLSQEEFGSSGAGPTLSQGNISVTGLTTADNSNPGSPTEAGNPAGISTGSTDLPSTSTTTNPDPTSIFPTITPGGSGVQDLSGGAPGVSAPGFSGFPGVSNPSPTPTPAPGG